MRAILCQCHSHFALLVLMICPSKPDRNSS
jgi:hypothetical protein